MPIPTDTRVVYGARCTYWGDISSVGKHPKVGLPCCPHCNGMLFERDTEKAFLEGAQKFEDAGHPGYYAFIVWMKGRACKKTMPEIRDEYKQITGLIVEF